MGDAPEVGLVEVRIGPAAGNSEHGLVQARVVGLVKVRGLNPVHDVSSDDLLDLCGWTSYAVL